jgi:hypothetical protein
MHLRSWLQSQLEGYGLHTFADLLYNDDEQPPARRKAYPTAHRGTLLATYLQSAN